MNFRTYTCLSMFYKLAKIDLFIDSPIVQEVGVVINPDRTVTGKLDIESINSVQLFY